MQGFHRCLVTGATGFIGSHLVRRLIACGTSVRCHVRSQESAKKLADLCVETWIGDLLDPKDLKNAVAGCDLVFHLAGATKGLSAKQIKRINVDGVAAIAQACTSQSTRPTLVYVSSLAALGPARNGVPLTEQAPARPVSAYGRSKLAGEQILRNSSAQCPISILRPPIVLGERDLNGLELFQGIARLGIHCVPTFRRHDVSLIHADDLVTAMLDVATRGERLTETSTDHGFYHVAAESNPSYGELGRLIGRAVGRERIFVLPIATPVLKAVAALNEFRSWFTHQPPVVNWDKAREAAVGPWICSAQKIQQQLGFQVAKPLQERINQTAQWYASHGYLRLMEKSTARSQLRTDA